MFSLAGKKDSTGTAAQPGSLGEVPASQDEDSNKTPLKMCVHLVLHHTTCRALPGKGRETLAHLRADGLAHIGPHTNPVIPSSLAKSFWGSRSAPGQREYAHKYRTEQGVTAK